MVSNSSSVSPDFLSNSTSLLLVTPSVVKKATFRSANVAFHQLFNFYLMALVLVIGVIANGIIVIVMRDVSFRKLPLSLYFTALALSDALPISGMVVPCFTAGFQFLKQSGALHYFPGTSCFMFYIRILH